MYTIASPIHITIGSKKATKVALNFNRTRNMHGFQWNNIKEQYTNTLLPLVQNLPSFNKIKITYSLYIGSNHKTDVMNWVSVVDKFFQDVLVKANKLPDDNYKYVPEIISKFGGIDKQNPRIEIVIEPI